MPLTKNQIKKLFPLGIVFLLISYLGDPLKGPIIPCIFNKVTGLFCPGCGMTRAINSLMHFRIDQALRYNFLIVAIPPLMLIYLILDYKNKNKMTKIITYVMLAITIIYGLMRNFSLFNYLQ